MEQNQSKQGFEESWARVLMNRVVWIFWKVYSGIRK